jgi:hypothetical protein
MFDERKPFISKLEAHDYTNVYMMILFTWKELHNKN